MQNSIRESVRQLLIDKIAKFGIGDYKAIWFLQEDGLKVTVIDYHETSGQGAEEIVREALPELQPERMLIAPALAAIGCERPYRYGEHCFPL